MPGMVVIASTPKAAREAVRRAKGKIAEPALSSLGAFKRAAPLREKAGLFAYGYIGALTAQVDAVPTEKKGHSDWDAFKAVVNPRGMGTAVASLTVLNGNLDFRMQMQVDFIDEDDGRLREGIGAVGVALDHAAGEIDHPGDQGLVSVAE